MEASKIRGLVERVAKIVQKNDTVEERDVTEALKELSIAVLEDFASIAKSLKVIADNTRGAP